MMELPPKNVVRTYELTFVIPGDRTSVQVSSVDTAVKSLAEKHGVTIKEEEDWGKKELAYTIQHNGKNYNEGYYHHFILETETSNIQDFEQAIQMNEDIIRHLLVVANNAEVEEAEK